MTIASDIVIDRAPWLEVAARVADGATRVLSVLVLILAIDRVPAAGRADDRRRRRATAARIAPMRASSAFVVLAGVLDVVGLASFAYGLEHAETWLVGLASSFGPAVTIIVAVALARRATAADPVGRPGRRSSPG